MLGYILHSPRGNLFRSWSKRIYFRRFHSVLLLYTNNILYCCCVWIIFEKHEYPDIALYTLQLNNTDRNDFFPAPLRILNSRRRNIKKSVSKLKHPQNSANNNYLSFVRRRANRNALVASAISFILCDPSVGLKWNSKDRITTNNCNIFGGDSLYERLRCVHATERDEWRRCAAYF